ncbi:MAG: inositol monophosphatase [Flavobacteriales bacterium]|nr:inositol monophosphatase [Flavobacteriales bacterium]
MEEKSLNSLVSYVDKTAEQMIVETLSELLPEAGFIAEEGTSDKVGDQYNWIIDPLDGTTNFLHGLPVYAVSIALQFQDEDEDEDGDIVLGVVYEVNRDECFYSWKGGKAFLNNEEISVSKESNVKDSLFATGFPYYDYERIDSYFEVLKHLAQNSRGVRRMGSAAVDLAYVACGRFGAFFEYSLHPWDVAAGAFIVQQAGGEVFDFKGGDNWLHGKEILATNGRLDAQMKDLVGRIKST